MPPRTVAQINAEIAQLATDFPNLCTVGTDAPGTSHRGQSFRYLRLASQVAGDRQAVLITAGVHAREWEPPDAVLDFARRLLTAYSTPRARIDLPALTGSTAIHFQNGLGVDDTLDLPATFIDRPRIEQALDRLEIYLAPLVNPDGRAYTMVDPPTGASNLWRKNNPPPDGTDPAGLARGVNLNSNFPVPASGPSTGTLWGDLERYYAPSSGLVTPAPAVPTVNASNDPADFNLFVGPTGGSEPETRFVMWLVEQKRIRYYMDVHTSSHLISFPWAMEKNGTDASMTFRSTAWDSTSSPHTAPSSGQPGRDGSAGNAYSEFMPDSSPHLLASTHLTVARNIRDDILNAATASTADPDAVAQSTFNERGLGSIAELILAVPCSGMDWAFSRQFTDTTLAPIYAFAFEGSKDNEGGFQPDYTTQYPKHDREFTLAMARLLTFAASRVPVPVPAPTPTPSPSRRCTCTIATAAYGTPWHPRLEHIRAVRDRRVRTSPIGRGFLRAVEGVYHRVSPPIARFIEPRPRARAFTRRFVVAPVYHAIRACDRAAAPIRSPERRALALVAMFSLLVLMTVAAVVASLWWTLQAIG